MSLSFKAVREALYAHVRCIVAIVDCPEEGVAIWYLYTICYKCGLVEEEVTLFIKW